MQVAAQLLAAGAALDAEDEHDATALHEAAAKGHAAVVQQLLLARARPTSDCEGKEPLHWAAQRGHLEVVELLSRASPLDRRTKTRARPLHLAAQEGHLPVLELLLLRGASMRDPQVRPAASRRSVMRRGSFWSRQRFASFLERRANVSAAPAAERAGGVRHAAAAAGHLEVLRRLSGEQLDGENATPLHWAAANGHVEVVKELLKQEDVDSRDVAGSTALHDAAWGGHLEVVETWMG